MWLTGGSMQRGVKFPIWFWLGLMLCIGGCLVSVAQRYRVEAANRSVSLALEYDVIETYATSQGVPVKDALESLKSEGLNSVVLAEQTIGELVNLGNVQFEIQTFGDKTTRPVPTLVCHDETSIDRVTQGLRIRFPKSIGKLTTRGGVLLLPDMDTGLIRNTAVGINPRQARLVREAGLVIVARASNPNGAGKTTVQDTVKWLRTLGATVFLPQGEQVLGRRDSLGAFVDSLKENQILYASPEFAKLGGDSNVLQLAPEIVIRLHAAQAAELDRMPMSDAVERYSKAARERNMRMLLLRPLTNSSDAPLTSLGDFVLRVGDAVVKDGGGLGPARPFESPVVPSWVFVLVAFGAGLLSLYALGLITDDRRVLIGFGVLVLLLAGATLVRSPREYVALFISLVLPTAGFVVIERWRLKDPIVGALVVSAFSLLGGLCIAALLNGLPYLIRADVFSGVKISVFVPILLVGGYLFVRLSDVRSAMSSPMTWGSTLLGMVGVAAIAFMIARTGNDAPSGVSESELKFRGILDALLYVRPRTKEFLIGHPALIIGLGLLSMISHRPLSDELKRKLGGWAAVALTLGAMGQTSIVNTLCHLHTPIVLSVARIGIGWVLGCIIGLALWAVLGRRLARLGG
ncbi:MAG: DUF5693 family protein [Fimbriimonas sp.]